MTKRWIVSSLLLTIVSMPIYAQSAKNAVQISDLNLIDNAADPNGNGFPGVGNTSATTILETALHTSQQKDLAMGVSLECGLYTRTLARSKGGTKDTSTARAGVQVQVVVDADGPLERVAYPGWVTFCDRYQALSATLQGIIENLACFVDDDGDPETPPVFDPNAAGCELTPEEIELVLATLNANAFFFALDDLGAGSHTVEVQARIGTATTVQSGEADAEALVGKGSLTVEEVRLVKGSSILAP